MDWCLAAATGRDARRDALLGQHLTDFVAVLPLIPHHRCRRRQVLVQPISTGEVTALPLTQVEPQGTTFAVTDPMELAGHAPPWCHQSGGGSAPLVEAGRRGMGFDVSGVNHQHIHRSAASDADNSEKIRSKTPLSHQRRQRLSRVLWGHRRPGGIHPQRRPFCMTGMMPRNTFLSSTRFPPTFLGKQGAAGNLLRAEPRQLGHHPSPPGAFLGFPLW